MRETSLWKEFSWVILSCVLALGLEILPLPQTLLWLRPHFVLLIVLYWTLQMPHRFNLSLAWCIGILLDILTGSLLGQHAFVLTLLAYVAIATHRRILMFGLLQQCLIVAGFALVYQLLVIWIQAIAGHLTFSAWYWLAIPLTALGWGWLSLFLHTTNTTSVTQLD